MQVPEKLALIGGSILLSSTLVFTLKSQASQVIPHVGQSISNVYEHISDAQNGEGFGVNFQNASQKGYWGTSPWYVQDDTVYIGSGEPNGQLVDKLGNGTTDNIKTINFTGDVTFPSNSYRLLAFLPNLNQIHGTEHLDTSNTTSLEGLFLDDYSLTHMDMTHIDTSQVTDMNAMIFPAWVNQISLGPHTILHENKGIKMPDADWKDNHNDTINTQQMMDGNPHPGTWVKQ